MKNISHPRIVAVSDVSLGYGSPQIPLLTRSLADLYQTDALIFEPDQSVKRIPMIAPNCAVRRVSSLQSPYTPSGRVEYISGVAHQINRIKPDVLVIFCTYSLPVLLRLNYRPRLVIYHSIEFVSAYGDMDIEINRHLAGLIDLIIFPEENRARLDIERCGFHHVPLVIVYNTVASPLTSAWIGPSDRRRRLLYTGTLDRTNTLAEYFLRIQAPIDLYGTIRDANAQAFQADLLAAARRGVHYKGHCEAQTLSNIRRHYAFSIVMWAPNNENQLYAAPNKFFEAIADGVPPITAPHPQCKMLVNRYHCGIVMSDWSFNSFEEAVMRALDLWGTEQYNQMVEQCRLAVETELNWDTQFAKIKKLLPKEL